MYLNDRQNINFKFTKKKTAVFYEKIKIYSNSGVRIFYLFQVGLSVNQPIQIFVRNGFFAGLKPVFFARINQHQNQNNESQWIGFDL